MLNDYMDMYGHERPRWARMRHVIKHNLCRTMETDKDNVVRVNVPRRMVLVPGTAFIIGSAIGIMRGGRDASLRFLAENAHRPPRTVEGWYFYKKTKNYRVMWGGLKGAGVEATRLSLIGAGYVGLEMGMERMGWGDVKEVGAGAGIAGVFSVICE